jgi:hypothetical protein
MASMAWLLQGRAGLGSKYLGERDARTPSWRGLGGWDAGFLLDHEWVTIKLACSVGRMGSIGARGINTICLQESREKGWTRLGAHGCRYRILCPRSMPFNGIGKEEKRKGGGVV